MVPGLAAFGIAAATIGDADACGENLPLWLFLIAAVLLINMAVAVYSFCKF